MNETIEKLIASGKEGPWWDFKQTYHQNNAALVHDNRAINGAACLCTGVGCK